MSVSRTNIQGDSCWIMVLQVVDLVGRVGLEPTTY